MQRRIITIPPGLLRFLSLDWTIDWRGQSTGQSNAGHSKLVYNAFPIWVGSPQVVLSDAGLAQWRAVNLQAQGRVGLYRIEMRDPIGFRIPGESRKGNAFSNGAFFNTGVGVAFQPFGLAVGAVAAGSEQMRIDVSPTGIAPRQGQIMSHDDWPFAVTWVDHVSGDIYDVGLQMPLRTAIADDATINLRGHGLFEATDDLMGRAEYNINRVARPRLSFREVLNR